GLTGLERALALRVFDDAPGETILDRSHGIEGFDLDVDLDVRRPRAVQPHDGGVADRLNDAVVDHAGRLLARSPKRWPAACSSRMPGFWAVRAGDLAYRATSPMNSRAGVPIAASRARVAISLNVPVTTRSRSVV